MWLYTPHLFKEQSRNLNGKAPQISHENAASICCLNWAIFGFTLQGQEMVGTMSTPGHVTQRSDTARLWY